MDMDTINGSLLSAILVGVITVLLYWYGNRNFDYWKKRNIRYIKPFPFLGSMSNSLRKPLHDVELQRYQEYGLLYGHFEANRPLLSVADPTLLRDIFVKDFHIFPNRRTITTGHKMVDYMISIITGEDWKRIRSIVTPTFSTGKIKKMMGIFKECSQTLVKNFKIASKTGNPVDAKKIYGAFTMDVIVSSAFSTKIDSHNDPENPFVVNARKVFKQSFSWRFAIMIFAPKLMEWFKISIFPPGPLNFFRDVTLQIIEERKRTGQTRNDFLQLLLDTAKETSESSKSENEDKNNDDVTSNYEEADINQQIFKMVTKKHLSADELISQCVSFFLGGYDTTASTLSFATYMLALNQDVQEKAHAELVEVLEKTNGELTYDIIQSMKYLDNIISETLRLYPPLIRFERVAVDDYELGNTGITLPKGSHVTIPVYAIQRDPKLFPNPEKFDPDRFTPEERSKRHQYTYLPFGYGPRNCLGMRFALIEIKVCLAFVIANFKISRCPQTKVPLDFHIFQILLQPKEIIIAMEPRENNPLIR